MGDRVQIPFVDLPGPDFLNVFGVVAIGVFAAAWLAIRFADRTDRRPPPPVPQTPDPMEVAFLQGGVNQVIRTLVYDLVQHGYAALAPENRVAPTGKTPAPGDLNALETRVFEMIQTRPKAHRLFENREHREALLALLAPVRERLAAEELIKPPSVKAWRTGAQIIGALILIGFAGAKIQAATASGENVSYLVFLCGAALAGLYALAYVLTRSHASRRGRAYLEAMRTAYEGRLKEAVSHIGSPGPEARAFQGASLFLIGLYGFAALKGTSESLFADHFKRASTADAGSCGASCAGSCGDGSSGGD